MGLKTLSNDVAQEITVLYELGPVLITIYGPNTVYIAPNKETLEMNASGQQQGAAYTVGNTSPPAWFLWIGPLYAIASGPKTLADFEVPRRREGNL